MTHTQQKEKIKALEAELAQLRKSPRKRNTNPVVTLYTVNEYGSGEDTRYVVESAPGKLRRDGWYQIVNKGWNAAFGNDKVVDASCAHLTVERAIEAWREYALEERDRYQQVIDSLNRAIEEGPEQ